MVDELGDSYDCFHSTSPLYGAKEKWFLIENYFSSVRLLLLHIQDVLLEKHDQTAESHTGVLGQKKKNFFSSSTYTGWGSYNYVNHQATFAGGLS